MISSLGEAFIMNTGFIAATAILVILGLSGYMLVERRSRERALPTGTGSESRPSNEELAELQRQVQWLTLAQRAGARSEGRARLGGHPARPR
jgi:hypothetical protein